uniref:Aspartyl beta-hydroxylase/Triadin domain-containing protein n=1 Tax=Denticeps clupeoides TaxID=299321 RepID=A0AAY4ALF0_9TELE
MDEPKVEAADLVDDADHKQQLANKNGKKPEVAGGTSFFTWFMVLALLGVWTSVAVVYFEVVDYQGVIAKAQDLRFNLSEVLQGKLSSYDADGDGDFDVEDAKVLLDEPKDICKKQGKREKPLAKDVGATLREALKMQLTLIHERVEARKIAKMALAEVRNILAKEEEEKFLDQKREEVQVKAWAIASARLKEEEEKIEREEVEKAMDKLIKAKQEDVKRVEKEEERNAKGEGKSEAKEKFERENKPGKSVDPEAKNVKKEAKSSKDPANKEQTKSSKKLSKANEQ